MIITFYIGAAPERKEPFSLLIWLSPADEVFAWKWSYTTEPATIPFLFRARTDPLHVCHSSHRYHLPDQSLYLYAVVYIKQQGLWSSMEYFYGDWKWGCLGPIDPSSDCLVRYPPVSLIGTGSGKLWGRWVMHPGPMGYYIWLFIRREMARVSCPLCSWFSPSYPEHAE